MGLEGSGVVADDEPEDTGEDDEKPLTSSPFSEGDFDDDDELDIVGALRVGRTWCSREKVCQGAVVQSKSLKQLCEEDKDCGEARSCFASARHLRKTVAPPDTDV